MAPDVEQEVIAFVQQVVAEMGLTLEVRTESTAEGLRINLDGADGQALLDRRAEPLYALQHVVDSAFRRQLGENRRVLVDCLGYRRDKDDELRQTARFLADRAKLTGEEQHIGPLNAYDRRLVHLAVAEVPDVASESIGDAAVKTVIISKKT